MSVAVTTLISFVVGKRDKLRDLAKVHADVLRPQIEEGESTAPAVLRMLDGVAEGGFVGLGRNGDVCSYGFRGNYTSISDLVELLAMFFVDAFNEEAIDDHDRVVVMLQIEQRNRTEIYEIYLTEHNWKTERTWQACDLVIRGREATFPVWDDMAESTGYFDSQPLSGAPINKLWKP